MNCFKSQKAFTIIEVMVVTVIIAIMVTIAIPSIRAWVPRQQLRSVKRDIVSAMQLARMRAIGTGHYCYIDFDHNNDDDVDEGFFTCYLDTDNDGDNGEVNNAAGENEYLISQVVLPDTDGVPVIQLPSHVSYGADAGVTAIGGGAVGDGVDFPQGVPYQDAETLRALFAPNGQGKPGAVYIHSDRGENFAIEVSMLGRVKGWKWNGANWQ